MSGPAGSAAVELSHAIGDGASVTANDAHGTLCLDVPAEHWTNAVGYVRNAWDCRFFDWLSAVDQTDAETDPGFDVVTHLASTTPFDGLHRVLLRTRVTLPEARLASITSVFPGAAWHERETFEMFGIEFTGFTDSSGEGLRPLLLPEGFEGNPLRKSFQLAARVLKPWPGAKEPGEGHGSGAPSRRKTLPPGVPGPEWGPREPGQDEAAGGEDA